MEQSDRHDLGSDVVGTGDTNQNGNNARDAAAVFRVSIRRIDSRCTALIVCRSSRATKVCWARHSAVGSFQPW